MHKLIIITNIILGIYSQWSCLFTQIYYNGGCVDKKCLNAKLSQFQLLLNQGNTGTLTQGLSQQIQSQSDYKGPYYSVSISYPDTTANQILGDLLNCINFQIYSTVNTYAVNPTRQLILNSQLTDNQTATWPISTYYFDGKTASISFLMREKDMQSNCIKLAGNNSIEYDCYFELAFMVRGITQTSYYFNTRSIINTQITSQNLPPGDFLKMVQESNCQNQVQQFSLSVGDVQPQSSSSDTNQCLVQIVIESQLLFCDTSLCLNTDTKPFFQLVLNQQFYMKHFITDKAFQSWYLLKPQISYQSHSLLMSLSTSELVITAKPGYNIYALRVPIVTFQVLISVSCKLSLTKQSRILQQGQLNVVYDSQYTGNVNSTQKSTSESTIVTIFITLLLLIQ